MGASRWKDFGAMLLIGDGMMGMLRPRVYPQEWKAGPEGWRRLMQYLGDRPDLTRLIGAAEVVAGVLLATCSKSERCEREVLQ